MDGALVPLEADRDGKLRFITYLVPSLPPELFEGIARHVGAELGVPTSLELEPRHSGPGPGTREPFASGEADVGFLCSPSYLWLRDRSPAPVELLPAAPVFLDPRARGLPVYFSDVVVQRRDPVRSFEDLRGRSWAYNDPCSMSGYYSLLRELARR